MKITLITQYYKPEMGAPQNRLYEMCSGLKALDVDISIITGMPNYPTGKIFDEYKGKLRCKETLDGMEVRRYWLYASNAKKAIPRIWNMISFSIIVLFSLPYLRKRHNDYIIVESPPLTLGESALILAKLTRSKLIMNVSDLWPLSARELGAISGDGLTYKWLEKLEKHLYKKSAFCMGQSQEIVDYIASHGAKATYLFRNGVDPGRFVCEENKKTIVQTDKKPLQIVYAGLLGFAQGIFGIISSVDFKSNNTEFHIYGAGGEQSQIEEYLSAHSNCGVFFHGKVSREQIPVVLGKADCALIPLVKNIFGAVPSKIYEAMAAGLPILFSGDGEGARIVEENNLGWVSKSMDFKELEKNIALVSSNREELATKKKNCINCASNKFNRPKQVKALYDYFYTNL